MKSARNIIASVDLIGGKVVRLKQGDYARKTEYAVDPFEQLSRYVSDGSQRLHIVDLDGARDPSQRQTALIADLAARLSVPIQTGGGIRIQDDIESLLDAGVDKVVIGSACVKDPDNTKQWFKRFGADRLVLALDCRVDTKGQAFVATDAWKSVSNLTVDSLIESYLPLGLKHVLCTDVSKDGLLQGANDRLYRYLTKHYRSLFVQASGGIGSLDDIRSLADSGVDGIIIGRALLEKKFTVKEAIECWLNA